MAEHTYSLNSVNWEWMYYKLIYFMHFTVDDTIADGDTVQITDGDNIDFPSDAMPCGGFLGGQYTSVSGFTNFGVIEDDYIYFDGGSGDPFTFSMSLKNRKGGTNPGYAARLTGISSYKVGGSMGIIPYVIITDKSGNDFAIHTTSVDAYFNNRDFTSAGGIPPYVSVVAGSPGVFGNVAFFGFIPKGNFNTPEDFKAPYPITNISSQSSHIPDKDDPNSGDGDSHGGGGGGTDDLGGDTIEDTGVPTIEATDSGLMTLYNPTVGELQALGRFLWSDGLDLNTFKKLFNDPFDTLLGLSIIPIVPPTSGTKSIMFGNLDSGVSAKVISHQFVPDVDMGTITLGEVYNGALDYSPFTTVSIYLPFIGYRELNVQDIMNSKIHLVYKFDVLTGGCIAELYVDHLKTGNKSKDNSKFKWGAHSGLLASFEGQCAVNIPLASQDYTNTIRAMIGAVGMVGGAAASFATGNPALGVAALAVGSANSSIQASTPTVQRSGHLSSSNAIMANLTPFLTVTRPHQCKPSKYYKLRGVPSQIYVSKLSSLVTSKHDYYLQVAEIPDIKVAGATDTEIAEIKNLLKEGVVL